MVLPTLLFFLGAEVCVRFVHPDVQLFRRGENVEMFEDSPHLFWRLKPEQTTSYKNVLIADEKNRESVLVTTNRFGLRGQNFSRPKPLGSHRMMALGDSTTFGYGVSPDENFVQDLQRELGDPEKTLMINAGVPGYSSFQNKVHWFDDLRKFSPDVVILANPGINDLQDREQSDFDLQGPSQKNVWLKKALFKSHFYLWFRKTLTESLRHKRQKTHAVVVKKLRNTPEAYRENLKAIVDDAKKQNLKIVLVYIPIQRMIFESEEDALRVPAEFNIRAAHLCERALAALNAGNVDEAISLASQANAVQGNVPLAYQILALAYRQKKGEDVSKARHFAEEAKRLGGYSIWSYYRAMQSLAQEENLPFMDMLGPFRAAAKKQNLYLENIHPNAAGHALIAEQLKPLLKTISP